MIYATKLIQSVRKQLDKCYYSQLWFILCVCVFALARRTECARQCTFRWNYIRKPSQTLKVLWFRACFCDFISDNMITSNGNHIVFNPDTHTHKNHANDANSDDPQSVGYTNDIALSSGMQRTFKTYTPDKM